MADFKEPIKGNFSDFQEEQKTNPNPYQHIYEEVEKEKAARLENRQRYGIEATDKQFEAYSKVIAEAPDKQEASFKLGCARKISDETGRPLEECYNNIDSYIEEWYGDKYKGNYTGAWQAICDSFQMGKNNLRIGELGNLVAEATKKGDQEALNTYLEEYRQLQKENEGLVDNAPRLWATQAIEATAQTLPFMGAVAGAATFGNIVLPGLGGFAATTFTSAHYTYGEELLSMLDKGIDFDIANRSATCSSLLEGVVEAALDNVTAGIANVAMAKAGKALAKSPKAEIVAKVTNAVQKKFHFGPAGKKALEIATDYASNIPQEMLEEGTQSVVSDVAYNAAAGAQNKRNDKKFDELMQQVEDDVYAELVKEPDIDKKDMSEILHNVVESARGAFMATLITGVAGTGLNAAASSIDYQNARKSAEEIPSFEVYKKVEAKNPIFEQYTDEEKKTKAMRETWEAGQTRRDKKDAEITAGIKETTSFSEQMEEAPAENEEGEAIPTPAFRTDKGTLYTNVEEKTDEDGNKYNTFTVGNGDASEKNLYGFIKYTTDEDNNTVTITDFKMAAHRRGLTQETFDQFAEAHAGENIVWNPVSKRGKELKNFLINNNASGKNNGLNYYNTQDDLVDLESRRDVSRQIKKYMPNLNSEQQAAAVSILEAGARRMGKRLNEYVSETFGNEIFGNLEDLEGKITAAQRQDMKGATTWRNFGNQVKAVIYAGEKADFSTFAHELAHVWQSQLTGDLKAEAEAAFNVKDGDWNNSYYTFADGHKESAAEAFARGFEDYLRTGKAPNEQMKNLFQKFAEFLQDVYRNLKNFINMSPEIENVYNQLMDADDSVLAMAEKAVKDTDREYVAKIKKQLEEQEEEKKQKKADEKQAKEDAKAEDEEITLSENDGAEMDVNSIQEEEAEEPAAPAEEKENKVIETEEELNKNLDDLMSFFDEMADTEQETETQIKDAALEALETMDFAKADEVINTVTSSDPSVTITEKTEQATNAAGDVRDDEIFIFQLAGIEGVRNLVNTEERARRIENYYMADKIWNRANKGYDKETLARKIKQSTGWEKNASGQWVYETDDTQGIINSKVSEILDNGRANALSDTRIPAIRLSALYKNDELYEMYPIAKDFSVQFFTDKIGVNAFIKADGIAINTVGLADPATLKRRLVHEIQHIIQAVENFAEGNTDVSKTGIHGKAFNELWQSLQQAQLTDGTMFDASNLDVNMGNYMNNAAEIDARNVARRAFMSAKERQNSLLSDTADVKNDNILFQLIGEKGAGNLDKSEESTTRMENLSIAKEMEKAGKDAKAIRLATGWEKGKDGLWRYEIDDLFNAVSSDFLPEFNPSTLTDEQNARLEQLGKKLADYYVHNKEALTDAELEEYSKLRDEANFFARYYYDFENNKYKTPVPLEHVFNAPELYKAYPELRHVQFIIDDNIETGGQYERSKDRITLSHSSLNKSTLLHEVQHAIQAREGFARGGNAKQFETKDFSKEKIESLIKKAKEIFDKQNENWKKLVRKYNEASINKDYETTSKIFDELENDAAFNEYAQLMSDAIAIQEGTTSVSYVKTPEEQYRSLAGEVESRNVEARRNMTPEERLNTLLTETADVAPEDQIVLFEGGISESRDTEKSLYGIHNLREDALRHVLKMGGIANPSMAVMDINKPGFNNFGEISLIPYNYMLEKGPGNKGTFGADIYSPRYPSVENVVTSLGEKKIRSILWAVADVNSDLAEELAEKIESRINNAYGGLSKAQIDELGLQIPFLAEKGKTDFYKYNETKFSPEILSKFEEYTKGYLSDEQLTELYKMFETNEEIIKELTEENGNINHNVLMNFESQLHRAVRTANKVDLWSTIKAAQEIIEADPELKKQFDEYANEKYNSIERIERIFNGYTPSGNRKYLSHTLENVSKYMKQQGLQGGENISYGLGSTRAHFTPKFTTLAQIKKAKDRLVTHEEFVEIKDKMNEQYDEIRNMLRGGMDYDLGGARFEEAFTTRGVDPISYIKNEYDIDLTDEEANELRNFAEALRQMPTEYFETKFERPVYLNEFAAAVIPANLSQDLKDELAKAGLQIKEYADTENREEVTKQALREFDETRRILFQAKLADEVSESMNIDETESNKILEGNPVFNINSRDIQYDINNLKQSGIDYINANPQGIAKTKIGDVEINTKGIENSLSHTIYLNKVLTIPAIKTVLEKGTYLGVLKDSDGKRQNNYYFAAPITIDNEQKILFIRVKHVAGRDKLFYIHDVFTNEEIKKATPYSGELDTTQRSLRGAALARSIIQDYEENNKIQNNPIYFQTVYHGSGAKFDKFNTDIYGLSGEGSMSFGYGIYFTDNEEIARDYAERQRKRALNKESVNPYDRGTLEYEIFEDLRSDSFNFSTKLYKKYLEKEIENIKKDPDNPYQDFKAEEKLKKLSNLKLGDETNFTHLYTVEIPDDGYLGWRESINKDDIFRILEKAAREVPEENISPKYLMEDFKYKDSQTGEYLYRELEYIFGSQKDASDFLHSIGYAGIKYPAGTIHGNGNGAYNYVIFNDEEAKIVDHLLFQTQQELFKDAMNFDSWQEFMEYYEEDKGKPEISLVPEDADASWYRATWEMAKGITHEAMDDKMTEENMSQKTQDALFMANMSAPGVLEDFLKQLNYLDSLDFNNLPPAMDAEEQAQREKEMQLKDVIRNKLRHGSWLSNATRVANGKELSPASRRRLLSLMNLASREYRDVYTQITGNTEFAVPENESFFNTKIAANAKKLNKLVSPEEAVTMSPEQLRNLADSLSDEVSNKEMAAKIKNGSLKMDNELTDYIKRLDKRIKVAETRYTELKKETEDDYKRIESYAQRRLLDVYDELLRARAKLNNKKNLLDKKIENGLKITEAYRKEVYKAKSTYDDVFMTWNNLSKATKINAEVQEAMKRKEEYIQTVEEQAKLQNDKAILTQISDMRRKLVKTAMRRIPLDRVEYSHAKKIVAIQRLFYPNLSGYVNEWIGEKPLYLKGVLSQYLTDEAFKEKVDKTLAYRKNRAGKRTYQNITRLQELLSQAKNSDDINAWNDTDKQTLSRSIPEQSWIAELNLESLEDERKDTFQLDIDEKGYKEVKRVVDEKGHEYFKELYRVKYGEEIGNMVKDVLGFDMFTMITQKPFEEWTTSQMEKLAKRINELYIEGRDELAEKKQRQKDEAEEIRERIKEALKYSGKHLETDTVKGTLESKREKQQGKLARLLHGYTDANVRRFARILDNYNDGANVDELYFKENACYEAKNRMISQRSEKINALMTKKKITLDDLYSTVNVAGQDYTIDELLFFLAADKDYELKKDPIKGDKTIDPYIDNDDYAPTARNAVMFGNLGSSDKLAEWKENLANLDKETKERIAADDLTEEEKKIIASGEKIITTPGTRDYISFCHAQYAAVINAANKFLSQEENAKYKELAKAIEDDYTEQFERLQRVSIEEFNAEVFRVKSYVPLNRMESNGDTNENRVKEDLLATSGASVGKNYVDKGMTQKRRSISPLNQKPVELGLYKTWAEATERTEHFINYAGYVRELNRVYKSRDAQYLRRNIENHYGKAALEYIDDYIAEVANPNATSATGAIDNFVRVLRGKAAPAYLSWKASSIIKQAATSPAPYFQFVNPAEYLKACFDIIASRGRLYEVIKDKSVFMANRTFDPVIDLINEQLEAKTNKVEHAFTQFGSMGMQGLEWIDWACVAPGWLACYRKKYSELDRMNSPEIIREQIVSENNMLDPSDPARMTKDEIENEVSERIKNEDDIEQEARLYADDCTRLCQPSDRAVDLAPLFKSRGKNSEVAKAVLQFQTSLNVIWQNIRYDLPYAVRQKKFKQIVGMVLGYTFAGILVNSITEGYSIGNDDEENKRLARLRKFVYYATTQFTDAVPVIGGAITSLNSKIIGGNKGIHSSGQDLFPMLTKAFEGTQAINAGKWSKAVWKWGEAAGLATGLPVSGTKELLNFVGIGDNDGKLEFKPQTLAGRRD